MAEDQTKERRGQCLCGAVRITAQKAAAEVGACHCRMCRRWGAGPFLDIDCGTDVAIEGSDKLVVYRSSEWAERAFCGTCGSNLFYRLTMTGGYMISAGLFDDDDPEGESDLTLRRQVFIDEKPAYYSFAEETETLTGAEVFAMFQGEQED